MGFRVWGGDCATLDARKGLGFRGVRGCIAQSAT